METRLQSAMEYLMTYGWAILAIAIVMVSLYSLGIFNSGSLQPTATPGSCEVVRTTAQTSLAGQCNNLIPKYVAQFDINAKSDVLIPSTSALSFSGKFAMAAWVYDSNSISYGMYVGKVDTGPTNGYYIYTDARGVGGNSDPATSPKLVYYNSSTRYEVDGNSFTSGHWMFIVAQYNGSYQSIWLNGTLSGSIARSSSSGVSSSPLYFGCFCSANFNYITGYMADVQLYNTSLDSSTIKAMYLEGIGGVPINTQNLVGWWPLNGNANDYSGNNNQGTPTNVVWNANWQSGYTAPTS